MAPPFVANFARQVISVLRNKTRFGSSRVCVTKHAHRNLLDDGPSTYSYDTDNRLKTAAVGGTTTSYTYSGDGNRISQTVGATTTTYVIDAATPLTMVLSEKTGTTTTQYLQGLDVVAQNHVLHH